MSRRSSERIPISFFAFQDIMLGVIGVVILVTLILLLQRTTHFLDASPLPIDHALISHGVVELEEIKVEIATIDLDEKIVRRLEVQDLQIELDALEEEIAELRGELRENLDSEALAGQSVLIAGLMQDREELEQQLSDLRKNNRITYLLTERDGKQPLVIELRLDHAIISTDEQGVVPMLIRQESLADVAATVLKIYRNNGFGANRYLLLVVKPSGIPLLSHLLRAISGLPEIDRFDVGLDLIPEDAATTELYPGIQE